MRIRVVGSGTLIPDPMRGPPAHWVEVGGSSLLLDCGSGTLRTMARLGLGWETISHLCISHFHTDHVGELAPLLFALRHGLARPREAPLVLIGPAGLVDHLEALARAHGPYVLRPGFPLEVHELSPGDEWVDPREDLCIRSSKTNHTENSMAVRVEDRSGSVGYTGDTGPDSGLGTFFRGCGLLLAECSHADGHGMETHLTPRALAAVAARADPTLLVVVHCYPPLDPETVPSLLAAQGYQGRVLTGWDGLGIDLVGGAAKVLDVPDP